MAGDREFFEYSDRNAILASMGYGSYGEYLDSKLWRRIRGRVLARDKGMCCVCRDKAKHVHHTSYSREVLEGKSIRHLRSLCATCHEIGEFDSSGRKVSLREANERLEITRCWSRNSLERRADAILRNASYRNRRKFCRICKKKMTGKWKRKNVCRPCKLKQIAERRAAKCADKTK